MLIIINVEDDVATILISIGEENHAMDFPSRFNCLAISTNNNNNNKNSNNNTGGQKLIYRKD